jgi:signal transduction histidine kinase
LSERGLAPALRALAERSSVPVRIGETPSNRLPEPLEAGIYYTVAEALANVAKHAHATEARVSVSLSGGRVAVEVFDDGVGGAGEGSGSGLRGLADRVEALGGTLTLDSPSGGGTHLLADLPLGG